MLGADADGAHAGICLETPEPINAAMDQIIKLQVRELPTKYVNTHQSLRTSDQPSCSFDDRSMSPLKLCFTCCAPTAGAERR